MGHALCPSPVISLDGPLIYLQELRKKNLSTVTDLDGFEEVFGLCPQGLAAVFEAYPDCRRNFFSEVLPFIVDAASRLSTKELKRLEAGKVDQVFLPRDLVVSLLAHMFLCTFRDLPSNMPYAGFDLLLFRVNKHCPQELAKLRMFIHYFDRCRLEMPKGELRIYRQVRPAAKTGSTWRESKWPLLELNVAPPFTGFEDEVGRGCLHADFANQCLGGGVLVGGCVQEEIRFSICPELCAAMLVCPIMLDNEAITIVGGEQFCSYEGYGRSLRFGADYRDRSPRDADGTVLQAITAMDALDFRGRDSSLRTQLQEPLLLRELEKAAAAFAPVDEAALAQWPIIATGNWGCGAFEGCAELKAILQWLAASEGRRRLLYFPFDLEHLGPQLTELSRDLCTARVTVGQLYSALMSEPRPKRATEIFEHLKRKLLG
ncbi:Poly(ADP-ribose) glycohydrolase [Durusdinium trenchii]|uniref:poly(ADP-ribose) glycohydrolase n=1 Tax=Durusdinium trenchii TaxID=1381693 RepID=A0ABP0HWV1_9DINO